MRTDACVLSGRQIQVLQEVSTGRCNKEIAERLHIHESTVKNHVARLCDMFRLTSRCAAYRNRVLLTRIALKLGLVEL